MDGAQMNRIESFLKSQGIDTGSIPRQRIKQLEKIDDAVQKHLKAINEAQQVLKDNSFNVSTIANESGIARKTFYNNDILRKYVESFTSVDGEPGKLVKASEIDNMKKKIKEQADMIFKMANRDIDLESLRHEADELRKVIANKDKQIKNLTELYESTFAKLHQLQFADRDEKIIPIRRKNT